MFKVFIAMVAIEQEFESFETAYRQFYAGIRGLFQGGGVALQVIETACFIQYVFVYQGETFTTAMDFDDCNDLAREMELLAPTGALKEGPVKDTPIERIQDVFLAHTIAGIEAVLDMADSISQGVSEEGVIKMVQGIKGNFEAEPTI